MSENRKPSPPSDPWPWPWPPAGADALEPFDRRLLECDPAEGARRLLGAYLLRLDGAEAMAVRLVEVEAYRGADDPGSHAHRGRTERNRAMFGPVGHAYVYFTYGNHHMLNVVCHRPGEAGAVLLRGAEPVAGVEAMAARRRARPRAAVPPTAATDDARFVRWLLAGPARLAAALAVDASDDGRDMVGPERGVRAFALFRGRPPSPSAVAVSGRIGLAPGRGRELALRFYESDSAGVSPARATPAEA